MDIATIGAFWLVALVLILAPGADWAFTLSAATRGSAVAAAVGGLVAGYAVVTLVVTAGASASHRGINRRDLDDKHGGAQRRW